jgi:hypothetical protein
MRIVFANFEPFRPFHFVKAAMMGQKWQKSAAVDNAMLQIEILTERLWGNLADSLCNPRLIIP